MLTHQSELLLVRKHVKRILSIKVNPRARSYLTAIPTGNELLILFSESRPRTNRSLNLVHKAEPSAIHVSAQQFGLSDISIDTAEIIIIQFEPTAVVRSP